MCLVRLHASWSMPRTPACLMIHASHACMPHDPYRSLHLSWLLKEEGPEGRDALRMLFSVIPSTITFLPVGVVRAACTCNNGANSAAQNVIWSVNTCFVVPLQKSNREKPRQNDCYGVQTLSKLTRTVSLLMSSTHFQRSFPFLLFFVSFLFFLSFVPHLFLSLFIYSSLVFLSPILSFLSRFFRHFVQPQMHDSERSEQDTWLLMSFCFNLNMISRTEARAVYLGLHLPG
jgi:hypothetical protein